MRKPYHPDPRWLELGNSLSDPVDPARFPEHVLRFANRDAAASVGLAAACDAGWIRSFGRFEPLPGNLGVPLALRYHGHQFGHYNPQLGDGRGFLYAQVRDGAGRLLDVGTKGSGTTPYSRGGDGRLTLQGGVREVLAAELLEALGVPTCRILALVETGQRLWRNDEPSPTRSCVLTRLSWSHVRIGMFQRLAYEGDATGMWALLRYVAAHLVTEAQGEDAELPVRVLRAVGRRVSHTIGRYMAAGFVHGVLNTDNINVTGESFDYGPWRFTPLWTPGFVAAYFDHAGRYAFGRQMQAGVWGVLQLAKSLELVASTSALQGAIDDLGDVARQAVTRGILGRLALAPRGPEEDLEVAVSAVSLMRDGEVGIDRFFHDWRGGEASAARATEGPAAGAYVGPRMEALRKAWVDHEPAAGAGLDHPVWQETPVSLHIEEVRALWQRIADDDDWKPLAAKVAAIRRLRHAMGHGSETRVAELF